MKKYFNLKKSILLLLTFLTLTVGTSPVWAQKALPYSYGFEEATCWTSGWTTVNCHSSSENYKTSAHSGSYAFRFYYTSNYPQYLISPELATSSYSISVSFWYKAHSTSYEESFQVGYSTTDAETSSFTFGDEVKTKSTDWQEYSTTCPAGTKYICIACTSNDRYYLYIDDLVIDSDSPYKTPKAFASTGVTPATATFGWTAGGDETAWQIAYSSTEGFDVDAATKVDVTTNPYTLEGLTAETTYYARIRADYGSGNYSAWSNEVSFKPTNAIDLTVNDGTTINNYVPFNGNYADTQGTMSQFIIPASSLTAMQGRQIQDMTFYTSTATKDFGNARFDVYMAETSATTFDAATFDWSDMDQVAASATVNIADGKMTITLDEGFNYSGDNLKIGFNLVYTGGYTATSWYGIKVENSAIKDYYGAGATIEYFLPKITFTSMPGPAGYTVSMKESTEDATNWQGKAGEGKYQSLPLEGVALGAQVSLKYNGTKRVKSVKAVKKAAAYAANEYNEASWDGTKVTFTKQTAASVTAVANSDAAVTWGDGWYTVSGDVTITGNVTLTADAHLILQDGAKLTINGQLNCRINGKNLYIYGQKNGDGKLNVTNNGANAINSNTNYRIDIHGGEVTAAATGNNGGNGLNTGYLAVYGGKLTATSGSRSGINFQNTFNVYGGEVEASSNATSDAGYGISSGGGTSSQILTVYGGKVTATGNGIEESPDYGSGFGCYVKSGTSGIKFYFSDNGTDWGEGASYASATDGRNIQKRYAKAE